jgi:hypothetical protein
MRRSLLRLLVLPLAVAGTATAVIATADTASAAGGIVSGTGTITVPASFLAQLAKAGIVVVPQSAASTSYNSTTKTVTVVFNVSGGDADVNALAGNVNVTGGLKFYDYKTGKNVVFSALTFDVFNAQFDGTSSVDGTQQPLFDPAGNTTTSESGPAQSYSASDIQIDAAGASYLDTALHTTFFTAGQDIGGTFGTSYTY